MCTRPGSPRYAIDCGAMMNPVLSSVTPGTPARSSPSVSALLANSSSLVQCQPFDPISVERGTYGRAVGVLSVSRTFAVRAAAAPLSGRAVSETAGTGFGNGRGAGGSCATTAQGANAATPRTNEMARGRALSALSRERIRQRSERAHPSVRAEGPRGPPPYTPCPQCRDVPTCIRW